MKKNVGFTILAKNYLRYGVVLSNSIYKSNPSTDFFIYIVGDVDKSLKIYAEQSGIKVRSVFDLQIHDFHAMKFYYELTEFCTSVKPFILESLMDEGYEQLFYIDPDILVTASFEDPVYSELSRHSILLTPHICSPIPDKAQPNEDAHLKTGTYNLGFIAIRNDENAKSLLNWWKQKLVIECFNEPTRGIFVDQKWINLVPAMFEGVRISRNLGLNMAYWNLHERTLDENRHVNGVSPLVFFHFSGFLVNESSEISKYQDRYRLADRPDLVEIFQEYRDMIQAVRIPDHIVNEPYPFNKYSNGNDISLLARRTYFWLRDEMDSPFSSADVENSFLSVLRKLGVKETRSYNAIGIHSKDINEKAKVFNFILRVFLRFFGTTNYFRLIKYFGYLSSLSRHQFLIRKDKPVIDDNRSYLQRDRV